MGTNLKKYLFSVLLVAFTFAFIGSSTITQVSAGYNNVEDITEDGWKTIKGAAKKAKS